MRAAGVVADCVCLKSSRQPKFGGSIIWAGDFKLVRPVIVPCQPIASGVSAVLQDLPENQGPDAFLWARLPCSSGIDAFSGSLANQSPSGHFTGHYT